MIDAIPDGIWPPHEVFYLESVLHCTSAALRAAEEVRDALETGSKCSPSSREWHDCALTIVNGVQTVAAQGAAISRYFWPARAKEPHLSRAARLRTGLGILENSPLRDRELRNRLEHFDENLDEFCQQLVAGVIVPTYVGPLDAESEVPTHLFRAYYTDVAVMEILGHRFQVQPVLDEIQMLHERLLRCAEAGGRIPSSWRE
jgi:hypothetical protein